MRTRLAPVVLLLLGLSACGEPAEVKVESTVDRPYDGPMYIKPDFSDRATARERSGAAGRALVRRSAHGSRGADRTPT